MTFGRPSEHVEESTVIYDHSSTHRNIMPTWIQTEFLTGIETLSTSECCSTFSLVPTLGPELNFSGLTSNVSEHPGPSHSPGETIPNPLGLYLGAGELDFHWESNRPPSEPPSLPDPGASRYQALGRKSMGSVLSTEGQTSTETNQG